MLCFVIYTKDFVKQRCIVFELVPMVHSLYAGSDHSQAVVWFTGSGNRQLPGLRWHSGHRVLDNETQTQLTHISHISNYTAPPPPTPIL